MNLSQYIPALKPTGKIGVDAGGEGATGSPGYVKLYDTDGVAWYLFVETDGTVKVHNAVPTADANGNEVGSQS